MAYYVANNGLGGTKQNMTTTFKTLLSVTAQTTGLTSGKIVRITGGPANVPNATNCSIEWDLSRITALGTGTSVTPQKRDPTTGSSSMVATANNTVEPTVTSTSSQFLRGANQQSGVEWVSIAPNSEIIIPNTNLNGCALRALSTTYASTLDGEIEWLE